MRESALDTFLKAIDYVYLHRGREEDKPHLPSFLREVSKHVEDFVEQDLLSCLHIVVYVFKHKEYCHVRVLFKIPLD